MNRRAFHGLGKLQAEVMELVWQRSEATVGQLVDEISSKRPVSYTTILVAMQKLEKKGWLEHRQEGRAYVYRPVRSREQVHGGLLREFLESAFHGDPKLLLGSLLDENPMTETELDELRKLIDTHKEEGETL